jgi:FtsZ-binding cell division protein ZapB
MRGDAHAFTEDIDPARVDTGKPEERYGRTKIERLEQDNAQLRAELSNWKAAYYDVLAKLRGE